MPEDSAFNPVYVSEELMVSSIQGGLIEFRVAHNLFQYVIPIAHYEMSSNIWQYVSGF